jgi:hypothetical protein
MNSLRGNFNTLYYLGIAEAMAWIFLLIQLGFLFWRFTHLVRFCRLPDPAGADAQQVLPLLQRIGVSLLVAGIIKGIMLLIAMTNSPGF